MKKILFALSVLACAAAAPAAANAAATCVSFAPAGYCDAMQYDSKKKASWHNYDCAGSSGQQTTAKYKKGTTTCDGATGCNPAAAYGWESLDWKFNFSSNTGTLTGVTGGVEYVLQQDMPIEVTAGVCSVNAAKGGVSSLVR
jgi:hypothetical protein